MAITAFSQKAREELKGSALGLSPRSYYRNATSETWDLIWEAGPYYERVAAALEQAHSYAVFVGWQIDSRLELTTVRREKFRELVVRLCNQKPDLHIYFLMWDHAYFYVFEREMMQGWVWDKIHERVHFVFDNHHPYGGSHHEKCVIIDGETAFLGGIDICDDRWDSPNHLFYDPRRSLRHDGEEHHPYHDLSVEVRGELAAELVEYVGERWRILSSIPFPERPRVARGAGRGPYHVLISRTRAAVGLERPMLVRETEFLFRQLIRSAQKQLVIENQYYWSRRIHRELVALLRTRAGTGFKLFMVVPAGYGGSTAFRMMGTIQSAMLQELERIAAETDTKLVLGCPFSRLGRLELEKPIYVHSKLLIVDDRYMSIGSANFNNRGFRLDTELMLTLLGENDEARALIRNQTRQVVAHWGQTAYSQMFNKPVPVTFAEMSPYAPAAAVATLSPPVSPNVVLHDYTQSWSAYLHSFSAFLARRLPVSKIFDPEGPIAYAVKRRLAIGNPMRLRRIVPFATMGVLCFSLGVTLVLLVLIGLVAPELRAAWNVHGQLPALLAYAILLSCSWIFRSSMLLGAICVSAQLGAALGAPLMFVSTIVAAMGGYWFSRVFPTTAKRIYHGQSVRRVGDVLGLRRLPVVLAVSLDVRVDFPGKVAYQGIYSIPMRWFALSVFILGSIYTVVAVSFSSAVGSAFRESWLPFGVFVATMLVSVLGYARPFAVRSAHVPAPKGSTARSG